ncbi:MAG: nucleotide exchange factor GrpE [Prevotella sp.]|nr:nucleotide exchange factor GrpE [Prevotella sp.]
MNEEEKIEQEEQQQEPQQPAADTENTDSEATQGDEGTEAPELTDLEKAQAEIEELKTQMLYKTAEFDNYRKRTLKEKAELILNGGEKAVSAILPVIDDMERAIANGEKTDDPQVLREGMELIYHKFMKALESLGVKKIDTEGANFDTDLHEAVAMVPGMGDDKKGKVIDCMQTGYQLNDKVIRHAKVAVGQ